MVNFHFDGPRCAATQVNSAQKQRLIANLSRFFNSTRNYGGNCGLPESFSNESNFKLSFEDNGDVETNRIEFKSYKDNW